MSIKKIGTVLRIFIILFLPTILFSQEWSDSYWEEVDVYNKGEKIDLFNYLILDAKCFNQNCYMVLNYQFFFTIIVKSADSGESWKIVYDNIFDFMSGEFPDSVIQYNPRLAEIQNKNRVILTYDDKNGILNKFDLNTFENDTSFKLNTYSDIKNLYTNSNGYGIAAYGIQYYITKDNWESAEFFTTHSIRKVMVTEDNTFYNSNTNLKDTISKFNISKDGKNWEQYDIGKGVIYNLYAYNNELFWATGIKLFHGEIRRHDIIYNSTNGGKSWTLQMEDSTAVGWSIRDIRFIDENIGIALSASNDYYTTTNGGKEWIKQKRKVNPNYLGYNKTFLSDNSLFQFVEGTGLYKYNISLLKITSVPLDEYKSIQTFPNPFQNSFRISANDIVPDNYSLKIYTVSGNLVLEKHVDIIDEVEIKADFPIGSYYLILENESNHYLKKLIKE